MAGGTFDKAVDKVRPGTYINFESTRQKTIGSERGTALIPLLNSNYGPAKKFIALLATSPDVAKAQLGYSIYDEDPAGNMLLIREAFKNASTVIVYNCTEGGQAAAGTGGGLSAVAMYRGSRGNDLAYTVEANPIKGYDVSIFMGSERVIMFEEISSVEDLSSNPYILFTSNGEDGISPVASVKLANGTDAATSNSDVTEFLDASEKIYWNTMAFPTSESALHAACTAKIKYLRENVGKCVQAVIPGYAADYEGIINVTNGYKMDGITVRPVQATAFVAGITAGATNVQSNTYAVVDGAIEVFGEKTNEDSIAAIKAGELFFSVSENNAVIIEYDINSLVNCTIGKDESYRKNRVIRVFDTFSESLRNNFPPNKFNNDDDGLDIMEGIGRSILKQFGPTADGGVGAIKNVDYDKDFRVDRDGSIDDKTYFNIGLEPVDSAEKLYFTISTR